MRMLPGLTWSMSCTQLPAKMPTSMFQFAAWLEDWITKLALADEVAAHIEPRRAMAVLMNVGKPLQTSDNIFMIEWVAIFRESGLRDDVTIANLQDACLKLVVLARARARELQVDQQVERAQRPCQPKQPSRPPSPRLKELQRRTNQSVVSFSNQMDARMEIIASMHTRVPMGSVCDVAPSHIIFKLAPRPRRQQPSQSTKPAPKKTYAKPKGRAADAQGANQGHQEKKKSKGKSKGKEARMSLQPRVVTSTLTTAPRLMKMNKRNTKNMTNLKKMIQKLMRSQPRLLAQTVLTLACV